MSWRIAAVVISVLMLAPLPAISQVQECVQRFNAVALKLQQPPLGTPAEQVSTIMTDAFREIAAIDIDCFLWEQEMHGKLAAYETDEKPAVIMAPPAPAGTALPTPFVDTDGKIELPADFMPFMFALAEFLAHDAYVRQRYQPITPEASLVNTPYRRTMLVPLFTPFLNFLRLDTFIQVEAGVVCQPSDQNCRFLENFAQLITMSFILLHENAHQRLGHAATEEHPLAQELAADASALAALQIMREEVVRGLPDDTAKRIRWMFQTAPVLWLKGDAERVKTADADARLQAALKREPSLTSELTRYVNPSHSKGNLTMLPLALNHSVNYFIVDGMRISPSEVPTTGLLVADRAHVIVAICTDGIAVSYGYGAPSYTFHAFAREATAAQVDKDADADDGDALVIAETSDQNFKLTLAELAWPRAQALHAVGLTSWIGDDTTAALTEEQQKDVRRWQTQDLLLASWR